MNETKARCVIVVIMLSTLLLFIGHLTGSAAERGKIVYHCDKRPHKVTIMNTVYYCKPYHKVKWKKRHDLYGD